MSAARPARSPRPAGTGPLRARICRPGELGPGEIDAWHRFQGADAALQNPFVSPEFAVAVDAVRTDARVAVIDRDGDPAGFLAYAEGPLGIAGPVAPGLCDLQAFVHRPDLVWAPGDVLAAAGLVAWRFDHLVGAQATARPGTSVVEAESWVVDLAGGWEAYATWAAAERARHLNWLERKQRRWVREHPEGEFRYATVDPPALRALMALKSAQCRRLGWVDLFAKPWVRALTERLSATSTPALSGGVSSLRSGERIVAADFSLRSETVYAGWHIAYDATDASSSPGAVRWRYLLQAAADAGIEVVDLGKGADDFKRRFSTGTVAIGEGLWAREGRIGSTLAGVDRQGRALRGRWAPQERQARDLVRQGRRRRYERAGSVT